jgi:hypothetical protein
LRVTNRQELDRQHVAENGTIWAMEVGSGRKRSAPSTLPRRIRQQYTHLSTASTAYGMQGATVRDTVSDALDACRRGVRRHDPRRKRNRLYIVAASPDLDAREQFTAALERDTRRPRPA